MTFVIPAYNEELRLPKTLEDLNQFLCSDLLTEKWQTGRIEILVVNDGSLDETSARIQQATEALIQPKNPLCAIEMREISLLKNLGKGGAIRTGLKQAQGVWILIADADGSTAWSDLLSFLQQKELDPSIQAIYGSRATASSEIHGRSLFRRLGAAALNRLICWIANLDFKDTQCGFKLIHTEAAKKFAHYGRQNRFSWDIELLVFLKDQRMKVIEHPVHWTHQDGSKLRPVHDGLKMVREAIQVRLDPRRES